VLKITLIHNFSNKKLHSYINKMMRSALF
jgi:hypothetical protein